jgi:peptidyl-prolyl cis-trans isomerase D
MLNSLRKASKSWVSKALLLLLLISFAVWGVSGQILNGTGADAVVTAGETKVSLIDYRLAYDRQLAIYSQQLGQRITSEQARLFGIDRQVLAQMVAGAVLDEQSRVMNLGLSKDRLANLVAEDPAFQGVNGQFSRQNFRLVLNNVGMSEADYIKNRQDVAIRQQIVEAVSDGLDIPDTMLEAFARHNGAQRDVEFLALGPAAVDAVSEPDTTVLQSYFEDNKVDYRAPEYRKINYVRLTAQEILDPNAVPEEEVQADYEARKNRYVTPETRAIEQIVFADRAAADAAYQRILAGQSFEDAATDAGKSMSDVALGTFAKTDLPDPAVANAAFALAEAGEVSQIVDGAFGPVIVRATAINPESVQAYADVKDDIRRELALVAANDTLLDIHDAYEDARAGGETMQEAAQRQKLTMETIKSVDAAGLSPSGQAVTSIPEQEGILEAGFEADVGVDNPPINAGETGFVWYEVADVTPDRDRAFEEVRDTVLADWKAAETTRRLEDKARDLVASLERGETIAAIAEAEGLTVQNKYGLHRRGGDADFGTSGVAQVFDGGPEHIGYASAASSNGFNVFKVTSVTQPLGGAETIDEESRNNIQSGLEDDLLDQMVAKLQTVFPVRVNQSAIERALSVQ